MSLLLHFEHEQANNWPFICIEKNILVIQSIHKSIIKYKSYILQLQLWFLPQWEHKVLDVIHEFNIAHWVIIKLQYLIQTLNEPKKIFKTWQTD